MHSDWLAWLCPGTRVCPWALDRRAGSGAADNLVQSLFVACAAVMFRFGGFVDVIFVLFFFFFFLSLLAVIGTLLLLTLFFFCIFPLLKLRIARCRPFCQIVSSPPLFSSPYPSASSSSPGRVVKRRLGSFFPHFLCRALSTFRMFLASFVVSPPGPLPACFDTSSCTCAQSRYDVSAFSSSQKAAITVHARPPLCCVL